jgi:two-component system response regulator RegX3
MKVEEFDSANPIDYFVTPDSSETASLSPTILIVDDETEVADTWARVLKRAGFDCLVAYDSPEALALFDSGGADLVLSDINLPSSDGYEIARYVHQKSPNTPIILTTSNHGSGVPSRALSAGASRYLRKPFSNSELITAIRSLIATASQP